MKTYIKPEVEVKGYKSNERFAADDIWKTIFGTGTDVPITTYTMGDETSGA